MYVVVWVGETVMLVPVTVWPLTESDVAPETDQERVDEPPEVIDAGDAEKEEMTGVVGVGVVDPSIVMCEPLLKNLTVRAVPLIVTFASKYPLPCTTDAAETRPPTSRTFTEL